MPESEDEIYDEERYQNAKYYKANPPPMRYKRSRSRSYSNYREPPKVSVRRSPSPSRERVGRYDRGRRAERSFSPPTKRKDYAMPTDHSSANHIIGVFGLSVYTKEDRIRDLFARYGKIDRINMIIDAKTKKSRGFCFIYFANVEDATAAKNHCNGIEIDERRVRVDYSVTQRAHSPTPGYYQGKPTRREDRDRGMRHDRMESRSSHRPSRRDDRRYEEPPRERRPQSPPRRAPKTPPSPSRNHQPRYERPQQRSQYEESRKSSRYEQRERPSNGRFRSRS